MLGIHHPPEVMADLVQAATFDNMRAQAARYAPGGGTRFMKSDEAFFDSGTSGKWYRECANAMLCSRHGKAMLNSKNPCS